MPTRFTRQANTSTEKTVIKPGTYFTLGIFQKPSLNNWFMFSWTQVHSQVDSHMEILLTILWLLHTHPDTPTHTPTPAPHTHPYLSNMVIMQPEPVTLDFRAPSLQCQPWLPSLSDTRIQSNSKHCPPHLLNLRPTVWPAHTVNFGKYSICTWKTLHILQLLVALFYKCQFNQLCK